MILRHGFTALEKSLEYHNKIYNVYCRFCCKTTATCLTIPQQHLFIELDIRNKKCEKAGKRCRLKELPIYLNLKRENDDGSTTNLCYRLSGVAAYETGHYVTYCRRLNGNWQIYNDQSTKPEKASANAEIEPHATLSVLK